MKVYCRILLVLCAAALLAAGCAEDPHAALYGKWQRDAIWEFKADGSLVISSNGVSEQLTYEFLGKDSFQITEGPLFLMGGFNGVEIFWKVEEDTLWMSIFPDQWLAWTRVK